MFRDLDKVEPAGNVELGLKPIFNHKVVFLKPLEI